MTRPQLRDRIPGRPRSVMAITDITTDWKLFVQRPGSCPAACVGDGPPVLLTITFTASHLWMPPSGQGNLGFVLARSLLLPSVRPHMRASSSS
jgi:hypothetical protein